MNNKPNEKTVFSPHKQYYINVTRLIEISKLIDPDIKYITTQINDAFLHTLFKDLRKGEKWYNKNQWHPIKTAIHNCYKLIQKGYVGDNQRELEGNIVILEKLVKEPNPRKEQLERISAQVVQNVFDTTLELVRNKVQVEQDIKKSFEKMPEKVQDEYHQFEKMNGSKGVNKNKIFIEDWENSNKNLKENGKREGQCCSCNCTCEKKIKKQKEDYEMKIGLLEKRMKEMEKEMGKMKGVIMQLGNLFGGYKDIMTNAFSKEEKEEVG